MGLSIKALLLTLNEYISTVSEGRLSGSHGRNWLLHTQVVEAQAGRTGRLHFFITECDNPPSEASALKVRGISVTPYKGGGSVKRSRLDYF
jgi:hypothetical protein